MSIGAETLYLDETWLEETPPCELVLKMPDGDPCGQPSEARVRIHCACGRVNLVFVCHEHIKDLKAGEAKCGRCGASDYTVRET